MLFEVSKITELCPQCQSPLVIKQGKYGKFQACSNYPTCSYLKPLHQHSSQVLKTLTELCPECGEALQLKSGRFGIFIGCSNYPACEFIAHNSHDQEQTTVWHCPSCSQGKLVKRFSKTRRSFYGCNQYPECKFLTYRHIENQTCPNCHGTLAFKKHHKWCCLNPRCQHVFVLQSSEE